MQTYAAVDLHSNNGVLTIIDETDRVLRQRKLSNNLDLFIAELEPYRATLQGVAVESTFNWYWLVDGLRAKDFPVVLVNTSAIQQYEGLKHTDDQYDAWWLAHMMRLGKLVVVIIKTFPPVRGRLALQHRNHAVALHVFGHGQNDRALRAFAGQAEGARQHFRQAVSVAQLKHALAE